jgi:L-histidine N-alpha-methyltransferase
MYLCSEEVEHVSERLFCRAVGASKTRDSLMEDAFAGLLKKPRVLPPKYFYDARGSTLFDQICSTPEYYLTRSEDALLAKFAALVIDNTRPAWIVELGSGTARKTRHLLTACASQGRHVAYAPLDVCREVLLESSERLLTDYRWLRITALVGDYHTDLPRLPAMGGARLFVFLGSTIGNLSETDALAFLHELRAQMGMCDRLLLGIDRVKNAAILHAAYNDRAGFTAEFNRNLLRVLNRELASDFSLDSYHHHACYNPTAQQIEMYLIAKAPQRITIAVLDKIFQMDEGDAIQTEISRKFTYSAIERLLCMAGFRIDEHFEANNKYFSLILACPGPAYAT